MLLFVHALKKADRTREQPWKSGASAPRRPQETSAAERRHNSAQGVSPGSTEIRTKSRRDDRISLLDDATRGCRISRALREKWGFPLPSVTPPPCHSDRSRSVSDGAVEEPAVLPRSTMEERRFSAALAPRNSSRRAASLMQTRAQALSQPQKSEPSPGGTTEQPSEHRNAQSTRVSKQTNTALRRY